MVLDTDTVHIEISKRHQELLSHPRVLDYRYHRFNSYIQSRDLVRASPETVQLAKEVREIKTNSIDRISELLPRAIENMEKQDMHPYLAKTAEDARKYIMNNIGPVDLIAQGSSDVLGEIDLDRDLEAQGIELFASGTYHRLFQLSGSTVGFNKGYSTRYFRGDEWTNVLRDKIDPQLPEGNMNAALAMVSDLKSKLDSTKTSISGANIVSASAGAIMLTHGLGNLFHIALKDRHLVLVGIDKIVDTYIDAWKTAYLESLYSDSGGGTTYQFSIRGPSQGTEIDNTIYPAHIGSKEMHVIFVDNGRMGAIKEGFQELLYCIRCFSCHNHCPSYLALGPGRGNDLRYPGFGYKGYIGGRGTLLGNFLFGQKKAVEAGLYTCTLCGACYHECPMQINVPELVMKLRKQLITS